VTDQTTVIGLDQLLGATRRRLAHIIDFATIVVLTCVPIVLARQVSSDGEQLTFLGYVIMFAGWMVPVTMLRVFGWSDGFRAVGGEVVSVRSDGFTQLGIVRTACWFYISTVSFFFGLAIARLTVGRSGLTDRRITRSDSFFQIRTVRHAFETSTLSLGHANEPVEPVATLRDQGSSFASTSSQPTP
jgi:hypothetical protein